MVLFICTYISCLPFIAIFVEFKALGNGSNHVAAASKDVRKTNDTASKKKIDVYKAYNSVKGPTYTNMHEQSFLTVKSSIFW